MAVTITPGDEPGYARLEFDRALGPGTLKIRVFDVFRGEYLGASTTSKTSWLKQPEPHQSFTAEWIEGDRRRSVFRVGPEICNYLHDGTRVRILSLEGEMLGEAVWSGIVPGPPADALTQIYVPPKPLREAVEPAARRPAAAEFAKQETARERAEEQPKPTPRPAATEVKARDASKSSGMKAAKTAGLLAAGIAAIFGIGWLNLDRLREYACREFGWLCVESQRSDESQQYDVARACADRNEGVGQFCAVEACFSDYLAHYHRGSFTETVARKIDQAKTKCEQSVFDSASNCADQKNQTRQFCNVEACFADYLSRYPAGRFAQPARQKIGTANSACSNVMNERRVFDQASGCSTATPCNAQSCFADYQRQYPNGTLKSQMEIALAQAQRSCPTRPQVANQPNPMCKHPQGPYRVIDVRAEDPEGGLIVRNCAGLPGHCTCGNQSDQCTKVGVIPFNGTGIGASDCKTIAGFSDPWCWVKWGCVEGWTHVRFLADGSGQHPR